MYSVFLSHIYCIDLISPIYIYTKDHLGQWRVSHTKHLPYDTDMRISMFMR